MYLILFLMIAALFIEQLCVNFLYKEMPIIVNTFGNLFGTIFYLVGIISITAAVLIIYKSLKEKKFKLYKWDICFIIVLTLGLFSVIFSEDKQLTIMGSEYRIDGYFSYMIYASLYICARSIKKEKIRMWIIRFLAFSITSLCFDYIINDSIVSIFNNQNHFAYLLTISCMLLCGLFVYEKNIFIKIIYLLAFGLNTWTLIGVDTFGSYLAVVFGLIFAFIITWIIRKDKIIRSSAAILFVAFVVISIFPAQKTSEIQNNITTLNSDIQKITSNTPDAKYAGSLRIYLWNRAIDFIKERPILGYGPEGTYYSFADDEMGYDRPHNEYLQHALFMGIPAAVVYILGLVLLFIYCIKNRKQLPSYAVISGIAVFAYCISAFFGNTMYYTTPYFFIVLGTLSKPLLEKK